MKFVFILLCLNLGSLLVCSSSAYPYNVGSFEQVVDHFNPYSKRTFTQKYLYQDKFWANDTGPIFFYAGNEGPIEGFWTGSGFIHEMAEEFKALVVFTEHRYYGKSLPFEEKSFQTENLGLLTVDQALADYAVFLTEFSKSRCKTNCKIIAFGGSYGGMLAAYMRFKYPNIIHGSLASSAPIYMQDPEGPRKFFFEGVTKAFTESDKSSDESCSSKIRQAFSDLHRLTSEGTMGYTEMAKSMRLCNPDKFGKFDYNHLLKWARNAFTTLAMMNYPYPTDFIAALPAFPVKEACRRLNKESDSISGLREAAGLVYNTSIPCFDIYDDFIECADPSGCGKGHDSNAWDFQVCTDILVPDGSNDVTDMFPVLPWNFKLREKYCSKKYAVHPRLNWPAVQFWGEKIKTATNIIFSNGNLDPWSGGGVLKTFSNSSIEVIVINGGAHHLDLRGENKKDPESVTEARKREKTVIRRWLQEP